MLVNLQSVFEQKPGRALAAFNVFGYEDAAMVAEAAGETGEAVVMMANRAAVEFMPLPVLGPMLAKIAERAGVPVVVHLDHSISLDTIAQAIDCGFSSVMYDGSSLSAEENIARTREVVEYAHARGVSVEGEIGFVGFSDPGAPVQSRFTKPEEARVFAGETGLDCMAVSIGTVHRMVVQEACLQFDLLQRIREATTIPLVIHGASGVDDADLTRLIRYGAQKINIGTALRMAFGNTLRRVMSEHPGEFDRVKLFKEPMQAVKAAAIHKIRTLLKGHEPVEG